jgi:putative ATP-dependent endonuclease of OLD family
MKISTVKISNSLSFPFLENFDSSPASIIFNEDLNILIGPNGSGKSNLIEILSKVFQAHFYTSFEFNESILGTFKETANEKPLKVGNNNVKINAINNLVKHRDYKDKPSRIQIEIQFDKGDLENFNFIVTNYTELKLINDSYYQQSSLFKPEWDFPNIDFSSKFKCFFNFNLNNSHGSQFDLAYQSSSESPRDNFAYNYMIQFSVVQKLIEVAISFENKKWKLMKNTFSMIGSMRTYDGFPNSIPLGPGLSNQINQLIQNNVSNSTKNYFSGNPVFQLASTKIGQYIRSNRDGRFIKPFIEEIPLVEGSILKNINENLIEIGLSIKLFNYNEFNDSIQVGIYSNDGIQQVFSELSTGQRSIIYLIFSVYGNEMQNGLLIVDEPELHLHTSMQKNYFKILKNISSRFDIQVIVATHSPVFIDEQTIKNTFRLSKPASETKIVTPPEINHSQKDLLQILTYTNSSRIFFADKVVLVEGDSDEYFFKYFYEIYFSKTFQSKFNVEFLSIGGKGNFKRWREFLGLFGIENYFIGDFDNIKDFGISSENGIDYSEFALSAKNEVIGRINDERIKAKETKDGVALLNYLDRAVFSDFSISEEDKVGLKSLWIYLIEKQGIKSTHLANYFRKPENKTKYDNICSSIEKKYQEAVFILKTGDLEAYLEIPKDINGVINFCRTGFQSWIDRENAKKISDKNSESKIGELEKIFKQITNENTRP